MNAMSRNGTYRSQHEKRLSEWEGNEEYDETPWKLEDEIHQHFGELDPWNWCDVYLEAVRLHNVMLSEEPIEDNSILDSIIAAASAQAADGAFKAVAKTLGINLKLLQSVTDQVYENQNDPWEVHEMLRPIADILSRYAVREGLYEAEQRSGSDENSGLDTTAGPGLE